MINFQVEVISLLSLSFYVDCCPAYRATLFLNLKHIFHIAWNANDVQCLMTVFWIRSCKGEKGISSQYIPNVISSSVGQIKTVWSNLPHFYTKSCFQCPVSKIPHLVQWPPPDQTVQIVFPLFPSLCSVAFPL